MEVRTNLWHVLCFALNSEFSGTVWKFQFKKKKKKKRQKKTPKQNSYWRQLPVHSQSGHRALHNYVSPSHVVRKWCQSILQERKSSFEVSWAQARVDGVWSSCASTAPKTLRLRMWACGAGKSLVVGGHEWALMLRKPADEEFPLQNPQEGLQTFKIAAFF